MNLSNIGIVGYGKMGSAIFKWFARFPHSVTVFLRDKEKANLARHRYFRKQERRARRTGKENDLETRGGAQVAFTHKIEDLASADLVIETIGESFGAKADMLKKLESVVARDTVLTTNTSSISISELAGYLDKADRFCGFHFFYPLIMIQLVEVIRWEGTSPSTVRRLESLCREMSNHSIVVQDGPGSVINRILGYYYLEALYILEEGDILPSRLDRIARKLFYIGPCESIDAVGVDFFAAALARSVSPKLGTLTDLPGSHPSHNEQNAKYRQGGFFRPYLLDKLLLEKRFGRKAAAGIYLYRKGHPMDDQPEFYRNPVNAGFSGSVRQEVGLFHKRLLFSVFSGVLDCSKRSLASPEALDLGVREVLQMKNGPFDMMKTLGAARIAAEFEHLASNYGRRFSYQPGGFADERRTPT